MTAPVSVVVPCFRCAPTIRRCVASVAAQTWRPAELILVDDGSDDNTLDVLERLRDEYERGWISVVSLSSNRGPAAARNEGWECASQPFVAFLDADDTWHSDKIALQCRWMLDHPQTALSFHRYGRTLDRDAPGPPRVRARVPLYAFLVRNPAATPTVMLRRSLAARFDPQMRRCEDYHLWLTIAGRGARIDFLDVGFARGYKAPFGEGGLSSSLWQMQRGEWEALRKFRDAGYVGRGLHTVLSAWSFIKFLRRVALVGSSGPPRARPERT